MITELVTTNGIREPARPDHLSRSPYARRRRRRARLDPLPRILAANIRNPHTRRAYARAADEFLAWCASAGVIRLDVLSEPGNSVCEDLSTA